MDLGTVVEPSLVSVENWTCGLFEQYTGILAAKCRLHQLQVHCCDVLELFVRTHGIISSGLQNVYHVRYLSVHFKHDQVNCLSTSNGINKQGKWSQA